MHLPAKVAPAARLARAPFALTGRRPLLPRPPRPERGDLLADLRPDKVFNYSFTI